MEISTEQLEEILYFCESWMASMRYGREYWRIVTFLKTLPLKDYPLDKKYYYIRQELGRK